MTALTAIIAAIGIAACLAVWCVAHWLAQCLEADDRKVRGYRK